jgi:hypothetical protein
MANLVQKHGRPVDLKTALRQSVGEIENRPTRGPWTSQRDAVPAQSTVDVAVQCPSWMPSGPQKGSDSGRH